MSTNRQVLVGLSSEVALGSSTGDPTEGEAFVGWSGSQGARWVRRVPAVGLSGRPCVVVGRRAAMCPLGSENVPQDAL